MIDSLIAETMPGYAQYMDELVGLCGQYFAAGALSIFIAWAIGFAIYTAFRWLNSWVTDSV